MEVFPGEAHDYERQRWHAVKPPLGKTEVVDEDADVCWNNVENSQKTLEQTRDPELLMGRTSTNIWTSTGEWSYDV